MTPGRFDLDIYRGDTYAWRFLLWQDVATTVPVDLTGATAKAEIRDQPGGGQVGAMTCVVTLPNIIEATLPAAVSATLPTAAVWDLEVTFPGVRVNTMLAGEVTVTADVTSSSPTGSRW